MITQQEVARKLGLSRQLVSLALAGYPQVSADSRHRILATARKMGYRPNPHARAHGARGLVDPQPDLGPLRPCLARVQPLGEASEKTSGWDFPR